MGTRYAANNKRANIERDDLRDDEGVGRPPVRAEVREQGTAPNFDRDEGKSIVRRRRALGDTDVDPDREREHNTRNCDTGRCDEGTQQEQPRIDSDVGLNPPPEPWGPKRRHAREKRSVQSPPGARVLIQPPHALAVRTQHIRPLEPVPALAADAREGAGVFPRGAGSFEVVAAARAGRRPRRPPRVPRFSLIGFVAHGARLSVRGAGRFRTLYSVGSDCGEGSIGFFAAPRRRGRVRTGLGLSSGSIRSQGSSLA